MAAMAFFYGIILLVIFKAKCCSEKLREKIWAKRLQFFIAPVAMSYFGMIISASVHCRLTNTLYNGAWDTLYALSILILVSTFAMAVGLGVFLYTRTEEWLEREENRLKWGFLYMEFTYEGRFYAPLLLFRQYAFALVIGVGRNAYVQLTILIALCLISIGVTYRLRPYKVGNLSIIPEMIANFWFALGKSLSTNKVNFKLSHYAIQLQTTV